MDFKSLSKAIDALSFERVASGRPLGKAPTLKTFVGREQLRWDAMQERLRPPREVIELTVFDMSHFGKELQYSANCH